MKRGSSGWGKKSVEAKMVSEDECGLQGGSKNMVSMEGLNMICRYGAILPPPPAHSEQ